MKAAAFDTLSAARDLEAAGFDRPQAEAVATAINHSGAQTATRPDPDLLTEEDLEQIVGGIDRETTPAQDVARRQGNTRTS